MSATTSGSGCRREFRACIVVGADGYRSTVARKVGSYAIDPAHRLVAIRRYYRNVTGLSDCIELHYVSAVTPGYFWIFPLNDGFANVGIGMLSSTMKKKHVNLTRSSGCHYTRSLFRPRFADATPTENLSDGIAGRQHAPFMLRSRIPVGRRCSRAHRPVYRRRHRERDVFRTGRCRGRGCRAGERGGSANLWRFDHDLWDDIGHELKVSAKLQTIAGLEWLLNFTIRRAARSQEVRDTLCAMIAQ